MAAVSRGRHPAAVACSFVLPPLAWCVSELDKAGNGVACESDASTSTTLWLTLWPHVVLYGPWLVTVLQCCLHGAMGPKNGDASAPAPVPPNGKRHAASHVSQ